MLLFDKLLIGGVRFVLDKLAVSVDGELNDDTRLREELLAAQMRVELGEMSQEAFEALEDEVLARIREIRARRGEGGPIDFSGGGGEGEDADGGAMSLESASIGVEADFVADDWYPDHVPAEVEGEVVAVEEVPASPLPMLPASTEGEEAPKRPRRGSRKKPAKAAPKARPKAKAPAKAKAKSKTGAKPKPKTAARKGR